MRNLDLENKIFAINSKQKFDECVLEVFHFQYHNNTVYQQYVNALGRKIQHIKDVNSIPFLPIQFFKTHKVVVGNAKPERVFESSGTTSQQTSKHYVSYLDLYERSYMQAFENEYGNIKEYIVLALLPSYIERGNSSLVAMAQGLISKSGSALSGFFLQNHNDLLSIISENIDKKILLIGVSFALLDLIENATVNHPNITVMETGGMKGRRKELTRDELHAQISKAFNNAIVHSEYGMTELLSQAYSQSEGIFYTQPWMKVVIRDAYDPFAMATQGKLGGINVLDLANLYSCSFIETQDLGRLVSDKGFSVEGRFDAAQVRGCNLMVE